MWVLFNTKTKIYLDWLTMSWSCFSINMFFGGLFETKTELILELSSLAGGQSRSPGSLVSRRTAYLANGNTTKSLTPPLPIFWESSLFFLWKFLKKTFRRWCEHGRRSEGWVPPTQPPFHQCPSRYNPAAVINMQRKQRSSINQWCLPGMLFVVAYSWSACPPSILTWNDCQIASASLFPGYLPFTLFQVLYSMLHPKKF